MAKKIINDQGETYVAVKPWYKKWWVWILAVIIVIFGFSMLGSNDDDTNTASTTSSAKHASSTKTSKSAANQVYKVGQSATIDGIKLTVNSVKTATSLDDYTKPKSGNQYYTVNVTLKNTSKEKADYNSYDFEISSNGNRTDFDEINTDDDNTLDSGSLSPNGTVSGDLIGQATKTGAVKLIYTPNSLSDAHRTFQLR